MRPQTPAIYRVLARITVTGDGCWEYPTLNEAGYGVVGEGPRGGGTIRAHRLTYEFARGPIPEGLVIDHLCRNRACCNPDHLEPVTPGENIRRGARKTEQSECAQGHPFTPDNTRVTDRQRICRTCERDRSREHKRRKRAEARSAA